MEKDQTQPRVFAVAISKTHESKKALNFVLEKIVPADNVDGFHLALIHIQKIPNAQNVSVYPNAFSLEIYDEPTKKKLLKTQAKLKEYTEICQKSGVKFTMHHELIGNSETGMAVLRTAKEVGAVAIVVGTRRNNVLKRAILGSVSTTLLHNATVPLIIVP